MTSLALLRPQLALGGVLDGFLAKLVCGNAQKLHRPPTTSTLPAPYVMQTETTCVLIKPDAMRARHVGAIIDRLERAGLAVTGCRMFTLDKATLAQHYAHIVSKPFYPEVEEFMHSGPIIALAVSGEDAVAKVRTLAGATNPEKADAGTIRKDFGTDVMVNAIHASDSLEAAEAELARFGVQ